MSQSTPIPEPGPGRYAGTYRALISAAIFFVAALVFGLIQGKPLDGRLLISYAGVGLFVGGMTTALGQRRQRNGLPTGRASTPQTRPGLERRRRGQSITIWLGPILFILLAAVSAWVLVGATPAERVQAIILIVIFILAAIATPFWALAARRATDRRLAELDRP
ncbi:MAG: hypothetical protein ABI255_03650 [Microbacteriaceae bacterium]